MKIPFLGTPKVGQSMYRELIPIVLHLQISMLHVPDFANYVWEKWHSMNYNRLFDTKERWGKNKAIKWLEGLRTKVTWGKYNNSKNQAV